MPRENTTNLYVPYTKGFCIYRQQKADVRYLAHRRYKGYSKSALFYTFEEAKEWLDNFSEDKVTIVRHGY
jgi:hypothetical protein